MKDLFKLGISLVKVCFNWGAKAVRRFNKGEREKGDVLKKLRNLLEQSVVILSGDRLSCTYGIANAGHGHFQFAGQFRE
ncbi:MAG: hypothetical protein AB1733_13985 [Thermodesulfobacteriota bacterium]